MYVYLILVVFDWAFRATRILGEQHFFVESVYIGVGRFRILGGGKGGAKFPAGT